MEEASEKAVQSWVAGLARGAIHRLLERKTYFISEILNIFLCMQICNPRAETLCTTEAATEAANLERLSCPHRALLHADNAEARAGPSGTDSCEDHAQRGAVPDRSGISSGKHLFALRSLPAPSRQAQPLQKPVPLPSLPALSWK